MSADPVTLEERAGVWHATLNRPEHGNACSADLVEGLVEVLSRAEADRPRVFVLQAAGRHFCIDFDLSHLAQEADDTLLAHRVGADVALDLFESGRSIAAEEACVCGLVSRIVEGPQALPEVLAAHRQEDSWLASAIRSAVGPGRGTDDAADLDLLVRSAARAGLQDRVAAYKERSAARRTAVAPSPTRPCSAMSPRCA